MNYLLDTHAWVWWNAVPEKISSRVRETFANLRSEEQIYLSAISVWEVAKLVEKGRLKLGANVDTWIQEALEMPRLQISPLTPVISIESTRLPQPFHDDPADQIIVATARLHDLTIITKDKEIQAYSHVRVIW